MYIKKLVKTDPRPLCTTPIATLTAQFREDAGRENKRDDKRRRISYLPRSISRNFSFSPLFCGRLGSTSLFESSNYWSYLYLASTHFLLHASIDRTPEYTESTVFRMRPRNCRNLQMAAAGSAAGAPPLPPPPQLDSK